MENNKLVSSAGGGTAIVATPNSTSHSRDGILIRDNVLSQYECAELMAVHESEIHAGYIQSLTVTRLADLALYRAIHLSLPLLGARHRVLEIAEEYFGMEMDLLPEFTSLTGWHEGSFLRSHYDANREYLSMRVVSAIVYLNDSNTDRGGGGGFTGGDLVFERSDCAPELRVTPRAGRLVCFRSTAENVHRVETVTSGVRFAVTLWFTTTDMSDSAESDACGFLSAAGPLATAALLAHDEKVPQPWETDEQASGLLENAMRSANLPSESDRKRMCKVCGVPSVWVLRHLASFCRWRRGGREIGDVSEKEATILADEWRLYVRQMRATLEKSASIWRKNGLVARVIAVDETNACGTIVKGEIHGNEPKVITTLDACKKNKGSSVNENTDSFTSCKKQRI